jgi:unsaturated rhamnogalacturonyl hydrolase
VRENRSRVCVAAALSLVAVTASHAADTKPVPRSVEAVVRAVAQRNTLPEVREFQYRGETWEQVMAFRPPQNVTWTYQYGVTLYGLLRASEALQDKSIAAYVARHNEVAARYFHYLRTVEKNHGATHKDAVEMAIKMSPLARFIRLDRLDFCGAMGHALLESVLKHGVTPTPEEREIIAYIGDYISTKQGRIPGEGILYRPEDRDTLWIDDLYMSTPFLVRWAKHTGKSEPLDDAAKQILGMAKRQQEPDGLWIHAAFVKEGTRNGFKWGRANGWAMVSTVEVLSALPENHPDRPALLEVLKKHIEGVKPLQAPSGLWHQVLDAKDIWEETSCSSMFAYSIARAVRRGWIPAENLKIAQKAFAAVSEHVTACGEVAETCEGTGIGTTLDFYRNRRRPFNDHHAPGPVMIAGAELIEIEREKAAAGKK